MNIKTITDKGICVIDNFYNPQELSFIWQDIDVIIDANLLKDPKETGGAANYITGKIVKNNYGTYLDKLHHQGIIKHILPISKKLFDREIVTAISSLGRLYEMFGSINSTGNLLSYYEDSQYYARHVDQAVFTILIWLYKEPKNWEGGILKFSDDNIEVDPKNNRALIFPSCFAHEVSPVIMKSKEKFSGRFTITHFGFIGPEF